MMYGLNEAKMFTSLRSSINRSQNGSMTLDAGKIMDKSRMTDSLSAQKNDYLGKSYGKNIEEKTEKYRNLTLKEVIRDFNFGDRQKQPESPVKKLTFNTNTTGLTRLHNLALDNNIGHGRPLTQSIDFMDSKQVHDDLNPGIGYLHDNKVLA